MAKKTFLWIEDRKGKASYIFWKTMMNCLFPEVVVEGKKNNSELAKAVKSIEDNENTYIIVYDNSFDNAQIYREQKLINRYADEKSNVQLMNIICFEYVLLEFKYFIEWIYAPDDDLLKKRESAVIAREKLIAALESGDINYKMIQEIINYEDNLETHNIEKLSAKLLFDLTRNTGFEVTKGRIGTCWITSCCEWNERQNNDICGLDFNRLSDIEKMRRIYEGTSLKKELSNVGLEVLV